MCVSASVCVSHVGFFWHFFPVSLFLPFSGLLIFILSYYFRHPFCNEQESEKGKDLSEQVEGI